MRKSVLLVLFLLALGVVAVACDSSEPASAVQSTEDVKRISPSDAKALLDDGAAVLYDTRSLDQYRIQHAAGAISFPLGGERARFNELPKDRALIFYCT